VSPSCAYLFPGQGSQHVGMGHRLFEDYPVARDVYAQADETLGILLSQMCFNGPPQALNDTVNTQPAILATSLAAFRVLEQHRPQVLAFVAGHSMGEFSALVASGALSFEDGLKLVRQRGLLMKQAGEVHPGGMAAVLGLERPPLEEACAAARERTGAYVGVANDNCPGQIVISGAIEALAEAVRIAEELGARRAIRLQVSIAAHTPLMNEAAEAFRRSLDDTPLRQPRIPIVVNATARPLTDPAAVRDALEQQLTSPVRWTESVEWMVAQGVDCFVEVGPNKVLTGLLRRIVPTVEGISTVTALGEGDPG
jgi:[acyl-carrier-protein] S-malonyltransferase